MSFANVWTHRKVAETSSKPCDICYKPSTSVLVVPDNKDFFFVCPGHLKDKQFCTPIIDEAAAAAKKKREMEEEVERVKKEYEEKQKKKKEKEKEKKDEKEDAKKDKKEEKPAENKESSASPAPEEEPRVFSLARAFYQKRLDKKRSAEIAKRNRERFQNPNLFPSVPKDLP